MNKPARYVSSILVLALAGCRTRWQQWDDYELGRRFDVEATRAIESRISTFRPGQMSLREVEATLGSLDPEFKAPEIGGADPSIVTRTWNQHVRGWWFRFAANDELQSMGRMSYAYTDFDVPPEFSRWQQDRRGMHPVAPEVAAKFSPGRTSQADVIAAWGPCIRAALCDGGKFEMCWGGADDYWTLLFEDSGVLAAPPNHCVSEPAHK